MLTASVVSTGRISMIPSTGTAGITIPTTIRSTILHIITLPGRLVMDGAIDGIHPTTAGDLVIRHGTVLTTPDITVAMEATTVVTTVVIHGMGTPAAGITIRKITVMDKGAQQAQVSYTETVQREEQQILRPAHLPLPPKALAKELAKAVGPIVEAVQLQMQELPTAVHKRLSVQLPTAMLQLKEEELMKQIVP